MSKHIAHVVAMVHEAATLPSNHMAGVAGTLGKSDASRQLLHGMLAAPAMGSSRALLAERVREGVLYQGFARLARVKAANDVCTGTAGT